AVKGIRDIAVLRENVFRDIGVQKIQRDSPNADLPDLDEYITRRQFDRDLEVLVVDGFDGDQRQSVKIVNRIPLLLPAVRIEKLPEISLLVQKADPDQREILVARRLQMVAGEDSEAARIDRQAFGKTIFG